MKYYVVSISKDDSHYRLIIIKAHDVSGMKQSVYEKWTGYQIEEYDVFPSYEEAKNYKESL